MKLTFSLYPLIILLGTSIYAQPKVTITPDTIDYGTVYIDSMKSNFYSWAETEQKYFWIKNTGNEPLIISKTNWGCDNCPVTDYQEPIYPGDSVMITHLCKSYGNEWKGNRKIYFTTNAGNFEVPFFYNFCFMPHLTGIDPLGFSNGPFGDYIDLEELKPGDVKYFEFGLHNYTPDTTYLSGFSTNSPYIKIEEKDRKLFPGKVTGVRAKFMAPLSADMEKDFLIVYATVYLIAKNQHYNELIKIPVEVIIKK